MGNYIPSDLVSTIIKMYNDGTSVRKISRDLGISSNTVKRYIKNQPAALCKCGQISKHRGWCSFRYASSLARQAVILRLNGMPVDFDIPAPTVRSRVKETVSLKRMWLGLSDQKNFPIPKSEHLNAIGVVKRNTKKVPSQIKDDVQQHMILSVLDGNLHIDDVPRAVTTFIVYYHPDYQHLRTILDAPSSALSGDLSLASIISNERYIELWEDFWVGVSMSNSYKTPASREASGKAMEE
jgi:hypothetical protein